MSSNVLSVIRTHRKTLIALIVLGASARTLLWAFYEPVLAPDTFTYFRLADQLASWDFTDYDGTRTPGYPVLAVLTNKNPYWMWLIQILMGIGTSLLLFSIVLRHTRSHGLALTAGLLHSLPLNLLFIEAMLLTESVSAFLLVLMVYLFSRLLDGGRATTYASGIGVTAAVVALTHPLFAFAGPLFAVAVLVFLDGRTRVTACLTIGFVAVLPIVAWMSWNFARLGFFGITTFTGFNLSNHSGGFMELAPPSTVRDIYLKHREEKLKQTGRHSMTIFLAREEIERETGMTTAELSSELTRISLRLFAAHPQLYLRSVMEQWLGFWTVPRYWRPALLKGEQTAGILDVLWGVEQPALRILNLVFVFTAVGTFIGIVRSSGEVSRDMMLAACVVALVLATSIVQALFEYGNTRYSLPTQSLVATTVLLCLHQLAIRRAGSNA